MSEMSRSLGSFFSLELKDDLKDPIKNFLSVLKSVPDHSSHPAMKRTGPEPTSLNLLSSGELTWIMWDFLTVLCICGSFQHRCTVVVGKSHTLFCCNC